MDERSTVHRSAAEGFQVGASAYERGRPEYPPEAVAALAEACRIEPGRDVLDLAAGTGKLTRMLVTTGASLVAVEPVEAMRRAFSERLPDVPVRPGTAEAIPLRDGSLDAVVVAQAFHWFDSVRAAREIHRILRADSSVGLVWNVRDESTSWVARLTGIIEPHRGTTPTHRTGAWREGFDDTGLFSPLERREFRYEQALDADGLVDRTVSISFIANLPDDARNAVADQVRRLAAEDPALAGRESFSLPYRTDVYVARRLEPASAS
jgi:SAM-dependent methyltransferase